jgi:hypothetical protein
MSCLKYDCISLTLNLVDSSPSYIFVCLYLYVLTGWLHRRRTRELEGCHTKPFPDLSQIRHFYSLVGRKIINLDSLLTFIKCATKLCLLLLIDSSYITQYF